MFPELTLAGVVLKTYAVLCTLAMLAAFVPVRAEARRLGWHVDSASWAVLISTVLGWCGAHLLYVVTRLDLPFEQWSRLILDFGSGNVWYGGFLLSWGFVHVYARRRDIAPLQMYDVAIFAVLVAQAVGRVGCFLGGCCYGSPTTLPWGVALPGAHAATPLHPTPLYEALFLSVLFTLLWRTRTSRTRPGHTAALYLVSTSLGRFLLEFLRGDRIRGFVWGWLSTSQFVALFLALAGLALYASVVVFSRRPALHPASQS